MRHFLLALLTVAASSGLSPGTAVAASTPSPVPDPTHPRVMQQAANQVATTRGGTLQAPTANTPLAAVGGGSGRPVREVFGFALASSLSDPTFGYPSWDFSLLTTVAFFGLHVQSNDGSLATDSGWNVSEP